MVAAKVEAKFGLNSKMPAKRESMPTVRLCESLNDRAKCLTWLSPHISICTQDESWLM